MRQNEGSNQLDNTLTRLLEKERAESDKLMNQISNKEAELRKLQDESQRLVVQAFAKHAEGSSFAEDLRKNALQSVSNAAQVGRDVLKVPLIGETVGAGISLPFVAGGMAAATIAKIFRGGK